MIFTIIIPIYNIEKYLSECIESVIKQSYKNIEIILVNDGSTDKSGDICNKYAEKDRRIKVINKKNGGLSSSRNSGIKVAKGDYILFLDGDDYWKSDFLNELSEVIRKNDMPDVIFGDAINNLFNDGRIDEERYGFKSSEMNKLYGDEALKYIFTKTKSNAWSACTNIYNTNFLNKNKLFFKEGILFEDAEWTPRVILNSNRIVLYETAFYMYRQGRLGSIMNTCSQKKIKDYLNVIKCWIEYSSTIKDQDLSIIIKNKFCNNYVYYLTYLYFFDEEFIEEIIREIDDCKVFDYVTESYAIKIKNKIQKKGYKKVLKQLNYKYRIRQKIKQIIIRFNLLNK